MQRTLSLNAVPPTALVLFAIAAIQVGAALATLLFPELGATGTVAVRIIFSAVLLTAVTTTPLSSLASLFVRHWRSLLPFGLCMSAMNVLFYAAIARIPLGLAVALEFVGPLGVALLGAHTLAHYLWVGLAVVGIVLLSPLAGTNIDTLGMVFALLAGVGWGAFILLAKRVGQRVPGSDGLTIAMIVAAVTMIPFAAPIADELFTSAALLVGAMAVAVLSTAIPFTFEFSALKRLSGRAYGVLVSLEPAVAAVAGAILLSERLGFQSVLAITCVVIAAIGVTLCETRPS